MPQRSDANFLQKAVNKHTTNERFKKPVKVGGAFSVLHYAGEVTYKVDGFLDKNKDQMYDELISCMANSKDSFIVKLMTDSESGATKKASLGFQFRVLFLSFSFSNVSLFICFRHYLYFPISFLLTVFVVLNLGFSYFPEVFLLHLGFLFSFFVISFFMLSFLLFLILLCTRVN